MLRERARERAKAKKSENILLVAHYDFIAQVLNALLHYGTVPTVVGHGGTNGVAQGGMGAAPPTEPTGVGFDAARASSTYFRHFNTAVTVVDIFGKTDQIFLVRQNCIDHLAGCPELVSGFPLGNGGGP